MFDFYYLMINLVHFTGQNMKRYDINWPQIPDRPYQIGGSESTEKMCYLNNKTSNQILKKYIYMQKIHKKQNISY